MEQIVTDSSLDKVLIITDRVYAEKANKRQGGGGGAETQIITPSLYEDLGEINLYRLFLRKIKILGKPFYLLMLSHVYILIDLVIKYISKDSNSLLEIYMKNLYVQNQN